MDTGRGRRTALAALGAAVSSAPAWAQGGGLILYEQADPISGAAHAGQSAVALDASTAYLNPAGMTRLAGTELLVGLQPFGVVLEFDPDPATTTAGDDGGDAGTWLPAGGLYPPLAGEIPRNWNDTWRVGVGVHFRPAERWLIQSGVSYDSSPVDTADRLPDTLGDEVWRFSGGLEYALRENLRLGLTYTFAYLGPNDLDAQLNALTGRLVGDYDRAEAHIIGLYVDWRF
jgi:long-subunit fatty acid transport protein